MILLINAHKEMIPVRVIYFAFYYGLSLLVTHRLKKVQGWQREIDEMLEIVIQAADMSMWNYKNKRHLPMAEKIFNTIFPGRC